MPTGACGINCDVCKLRLLGTCSSCGPGKSIEAVKKLEAQRRLLGSTCPILACAHLNRIDYCLRDCNSFPCENFTSGPYPYGQGFLMMQERRRRMNPPALTPNRTPIEVPAEYWEKLRRIDRESLCHWTAAAHHPTGGIVLTVLERKILIDPDNCRLLRLRGTEPEEMGDPLLELLTLLYLTEIEGGHPACAEVIGLSDLKEAHYFKDRHALDLEPLLERYGKDLPGFRQAAEFLGAKAVEMADLSYRFLPFPRIALYVLLWGGDEEFPPRVSVLFERPVERIFSAPGIWLLVSLVTRELLMGPEISPPHTSTRPHKRNGLGSPTP